MTQYVDVSLLFVLRYNCNHGEQSFCLNCCFSFFFSFYSEGFHKQKAKNEYFLFSCLIVLTYTIHGVISRYFRRRHNATLFFFFSVALTFI